MRRLFLSALAIFSCCTMASAEEAQAQRNLEAVARKSLEEQRHKAIQRLNASQRAIETKRKALLAAIASAQSSLRQQQTAHDKTVARHQQLEQQLADAKQAQQTGQIEVGRLARTLAGEGAPLSSTAQADEILQRWPEIRARIGQRLDELRRSTSPSQDRLTVLDRNGQEVTVEVWHWGDAQRIAIGDSHATRGLLLRLDDGFWQIAGPKLPGSFPSERMVADLTGYVSLNGSYDSGIGALIRQAGPFIWPILLTALLGALLILDRVWLLWRWQTPSGLLEQVLKQPHSLTPHQALLQGHRHAPCAYLIERIVGCSAQSVDVRQHEAGAALVEAETRLQRGLRLLAVLAAAAPLLGLLGTVTGMISSFQALDLGQGNNAGELSAGIGEALLTTEFGLIVAVPLLVAHAIFARDAQRRRANAESFAMRLLAAQDNPDERVAP